MIYFIRSPDGPIKIGTSLRLSQRIRQLEAKTQRNLVILGIMKGEQKRERELHARFSALRIEGEWFQPHSDLLRYIGRHARPWVGNDEVNDTTKAITVRGGKEWRGWLERLAIQFESKPLLMIDRALTELAERVKFEAPPAR